MQHEHSGEVQHRLVTMADLSAMSPAELEVIDKALAILGEKEEPTKVIEHQPIIDVVDDTDTMAALNALEED